MEKEGPITELKETSPDAFENNRKIEELKNLEIDEDDEDEDNVDNSNNALDAIIKEEDDDEAEEDISIYSSQHEEQVDELPIQNVDDEDQIPKDSEAQIIGHDDDALLGVKGNPTGDESELAQQSDGFYKAEEENRTTIESSSSSREYVVEGQQQNGLFHKLKEENRSTEEQPSIMVEKAVALRNFVRQKSMVVVSSMMRHLSRKYEEKVMPATNNFDDNKDSEFKKEVCENNNNNNDDDARESNNSNEGSQQEPLAVKGRVILYTKLGCKESREIRLFLNRKRLRYIEINIDVYTNRKKELERRSGSDSVPKVFFNEILIGGLSELNALDDSGELGHKIDYLVSDMPSFEAPLPPFSGEDDAACSGAIDELALIVCNMKKSIVVRDRFCKMRRFTNCFVGFEAVDFLSQDQYLERQEAVEFGRKLGSKLFFRHVLDEHVFEDGNHLYRFLDDDPIVASCQNIQRGIITTKTKPIAEIASRLRFLCYAIFEAYVSEDGLHVDYRSIHGSEEFARYVRIVEELQRVELWDLSREEKLSFFINLYNMMSIHAILVWGQPDGTLERRKFFADFKYVIGGNTYTLLAIQNGILRANQRPPYTLMKPFSAKDKRLKVALAYPEPLIHFALVFGTRSGPALRCYSVGDIDQELVDAARTFLKTSGGISIDYSAKVAYANKILKWFSVDFGKTEVELLKHVSNYLDPNDSELLLDLLATCELKIIYQPYDWGLNS
ncbi:hypothetical protein PIB30_041671 [Stylosanthes scabra]|uniref:DEP domain-containing protein n=1 Tax=Stylosanthes scabra TaxID=79078 RepID=A0ABU6SF62_9FABA|nr:hypothetical protein [Stylosanthes scabra]